VRYSVWITPDIGSELSRQLLEHIGVLGVLGRSPRVNAFRFMPRESTKCKDVGRDPTAGFYRIIYTYVIVARIKVRLRGVERV